MPPKNTDPNRPKGRTSAYAFFVKHRRETFKKQGKSMDFSSFARDCSDAWKDMKDDSKKRFSEMAAEDKKRYDKEMSTYVAPADSARGRGRGRKKDPNAPKRPLSAFLFFCQEKRPHVKAINPDYTIGDVAKVLGKEWKELDEDDKKPFEELAKKDRKRYDQEKKDYVPAEEDDDEEDDYED